MRWFRVGSQCRQAAQHKIFYYLAPPCICYDSNSYSNLGTVMGCTFTPLTEREKERRGREWGGRVGEFSIVKNIVRTLYLIKQVNCVISLCWICNYKTCVACWSMCVVIIVLVCVVLVCVVLNFVSFTHPFSRLSFHPSFFFLFSLSLFQYFWNIVKLSLSLSVFLFSFYVSHTLALSPLLPVSHSFTQLIQSSRNTRKHYGREKENKEGAQGS